MSLKVNEDTSNTASKSTPGASFSTTLSGLYNYFSFLWPSSSSSATDPSALTEKKVTEQTSSQPLSIKMVWQTNFTTPGADSGTADFASLSSILKRNDVAILAVQKNYLCKPLKTWQASILGDYDTYLGAEDNRVYFDGDLYFSALSSESRGVLRFSEDGSKEGGQFIPLSSGGDDSWDLSPMNSTKEFQTLLCYNGWNLSFSLWNLNIDQPKKIFGQEGYTALASNVGPFKILGIKDKTKNLEAWDLVKKEMMWSLDKWLDPSTNGDPRMGLYLNNRNWQFVTCQGKFYCFDLTNPKLLWKAQAGKSLQYIDDFKVIGDQYVMVRCSHDVFLYNLEDGSLLREFETGGSDKAIAFAGLQMAALDAKNTKKPLIYDLQNGKVVVQCQEAPWEVDSFTLSGNFLVGFHLKNDPNPDIKDALSTWDKTTGSLISTFPFNQGQNYRLLDASEQFLVFIATDVDKAKKTQVEKKNRPMVSRKYSMTEKAAQVKGTAKAAEETGSRSIPIVPPVSVINLIVWDIKQQAFAGLITEKINDVSGDAPMLVSFNKGIFTCSWLSEKTGEQILIKEYAWDDRFL